MLSRILNFPFFSIRDRINNSFMLIQFEEKTMFDKFIDPPREPFEYTYVRIADRAELIHVITESRDILVFVMPALTWQCK